MNVVIPTRFTSPLLPALIEAAQQVAEVIIVHTEAGHPPVHGCVNVLDERRNIHHWWLTGLDASNGGPTLICNDDITATPEALRTMLDLLADADLVVLPKDYGTTPLSGWCYGIHEGGPLEPDPAYTWWYGEDDIWQRAIRNNLRIVTADVDVKHDRGDSPILPREFKQAVAADRRLYARRWK